MEAICICELQLLAGVGGEETGVLEKLPGEGGVETGVLEKLPGEGLQKMPHTKA